MVFRNAEMEILIKANPKSKGELHMVKGFGDKKVEKYGENLFFYTNLKEIKVKRSEEHTSELQSQ